MSAVLSRVALLASTLTTVAGLAVASAPFWIDIIPFQKLLPRQPVDRTQESVKSARGNPSLLSIALTEMFSLIMNAGS